MMHGSLIESIKINDISAIPKYVQLANAVVDAVKNNIIRVGDSLPSIHTLSLQLHVSRDTVEKGYNMLKRKDVIASKRGKGCYVSTSDFVGKRVAFLFNKLSENKKMVYDSFAKELHEYAEIDSFVYNSDADCLKSILNTLSQDYDYYVVFPHFKAGRDKASEVLSLIPDKKLVLLGKDVEDLTGDFSVVCENYEKDLYTALESLLDRLNKYDTIKLVFPDNSDYPKAIIKGFYRFCQDYAFDHILVEDLPGEEINTGTCYINLAEEDLVALLDKVVQEGLQVGQDVGIISYNDTPLKQFILNGITTISADFDLMGKYAAERILKQTSCYREVPFYTKIRSSV